MTVEDDPNYGYTRPMRLAVGNAHMLCEDCGGKLYDFDGFEDQSRPCPHPEKCRDEQL